MAKIDHIWNGLEPSISLQIEEDALSNISPTKAQMLASGGKAAEVLRLQILDAHALEILANG